MEEKRIFDLVLVKYGRFLVNCGNILVKSGRFLVFFGIDVPARSRPEGEYQRLRSQPGTQCDFPLCPADCEIRSGG
jgi:hypothetical protein